MRLIAIEKRILVVALTLVAFWILSKVNLVSKIVHWIDDLVPYTFLAIIPLRVRFYLLDNGNLILTIIICMCLYDLICPRERGAASPEQMEQATKTHSRKAETDMNESTADHRAARSGGEQQI